MKSGEVSAYIFLITRAGDLKPARLAKIYLFRLDLADAYGVTLKRQVGLLQVTTCKLEMNAHDIAIQSAIKAAMDQGATDAFYLLQADEEGKLQSNDIEPGAYAMLVRGRAGANDAYWEEAVKIDAGKTTQIKAAEPLLACSDLEE
jgi:hypothetical protein